jgi:hypothetical protein
MCCLHVEKQLSGNPKGPLDTRRHLGSRGNFAV